MQLVVGACLLLLGHVAKFLKQDLLLFKQLARLMLKVGDLSASGAGAAVKDRARRLQLPAVLLDRVCLLIVDEPRLRGRGRLMLLVQKGLLLLLHDHHLTLHDLLLSLLLLVLVHAVAAPIIDRMEVLLWRFRDQASRLGFHGLGEMR